MAEFSDKPCLEIRADGNICAKPAIDREAERCILHSSLPDKDSYEFFKALKELIEAGDYDFSGVKFLQPMEPGIEYFPPGRKVIFDNAVFSNNLKINEKEIKCELSFIGTQFNSAFTLTKSELYEKVVFKDAQFKQNADFRLNDIKESLSINGCIFFADARFCASDFTASLVCLNSKFNGSADFSCSSFEGKSRFLNSSFIEDANFSNCTFEGSTAFESCLFQADAYFSNAVFANRIAMIDCSFYKTANFVLCENKEPFIFKGTKFGVKLDFISEVKMGMWGVKDG